ncbi:MAG: TIGR02186 family protein [Alphaproteobacteria bacterium]|nr:TIGR02186 family protein [Alphaproteobacteria bacterium]
MIRTAFVILLVMMTPAHAAPLIADLSNYQITMDSSFNGTRLFVFGTRNDAGDVVVVIRGPTKNYVVRKKRQIGGIWVNAERIKLFRIPDFYAITSSKPFAEMPYHNMFRQLAIGQNNLFKSPFEGKAQASYQEFTDAFVNYQRQRQLYSSQPSTFTFMGETLFKTVIEFPDNIPPGMYNAEIYLLQDSTIIGTHVLPITVSKVGIDAFIYDFAHRQPFLYGLVAILFALFAGWFAGRLFEKA